MILERFNFYQGKIYGLSKIIYMPPNKKDGFEGVGVFTAGELHMGPFTCKQGNGETIYFSNMIKGRPDDSTTGLTFS